MPEPTLSELATQIRDGFAHDERVRALEQDVAALRLLPNEVRRMEDRLVEAIKANGPKPIWPVVGGLASVMMVLMALFALIYSR